MCSEPSGELSLKFQHHNIILFSSSLTIILSPFTLSLPTQSPAVSECSFRLIPTWCLIENSGLCENDDFLFSAEETIIQTITETLQSLKLCIFLSHSYL